MLWKVETTKKMFEAVLLSNESIQLELEAIAKAIFNATQDIEEVDYIAGLVQCLERSAQALQVAMK